MGALMKPDTKKRACDPYANKGGTAESHFSSLQGEKRLFILLKY